MKSNIIIFSIFFIKIINVLHLNSLFIKKTSYIFLKKKINNNMLQIRLIKNQIVYNKLKYFEN